MSNAMSLKAKIRNIAKAKNLPAQVILQNCSNCICQAKRIRTVSKVRILFHMTRQ